MPVASDRECVLVSPAGTDRSTDPLVDYLMSVQVDESQLEVRKVATSAPLGRSPCEARQISGRSGRLAWRARPNGGCSQ